MAGLLRHDERGRVLRRAIDVVSAHPCPARPRSNSLLSRDGLIGLCVQCDTCRRLIDLVWLQLPGTSDPMVTWARSHRDHSRGRTGCKNTMARAINSSIGFIEGNAR